MTIFNFELITVTLKENVWQYLNYNILIPYFKLLNNLAQESLNLKNNSIKIIVWEETYVEYPKKSLPSLQTTL